MLNDINTNKLQDMFYRLDPEAKKAVYTLLEILACRNIIPENLNAFDDSLDLIEKSGFSRKEQLDNFEQTPPLTLVQKAKISKTEAEDIADFNQTIDIPVLKATRTIKKSAKLPITERNKIKKLLEKTPLLDLWYKRYDSERIQKMSKEVFDEVQELYDPQSRIWNKEVFPRMKALGYTDLKPKAKLAVFIADRKGYL